MNRPLFTFIRQVKARIRLVSAALFGVALHLTLPTDWPSSPTTRILLCWNAAVALYLLMALWVMRQSDVEHMRQRAYRQDEGQKTILLLTIGAVLALTINIAASLM